MSRLLFCYKILLLVILLSSLDPSMPRCQIIQYSRRLTCHFILHYCKSVYYTLSHILKYSFSDTPESFSLTLSRKLCIV